MVIQSILIPQCAVKSLIWTGANDKIGVKNNYIILVTYVVVDDPRIWGFPQTPLNSVSKHGNRKPFT